jgi:hypothetical protein
MDGSGLNQLLVRFPANLRRDRGNGGNAMMNPLDYGRSFLIGTVPANEVRFWVESRTRIIDEVRDVSEDYVQAASCKSEDTFAERDLFYEDNYDFIPVFGPVDGIMYRRKAWLNPNYKTCMRAKEMWGGQTYHLVEAESFEKLETTDAVIQATRGFHPIVAQTEIWDAQTELRAVLEYPVKTMNTDRRRPIYQVDTGPVMFPDLSKRFERHVESLYLAFVAFNAFHFADFVLEVPTPTGTQEVREDPATMIYHFSRRLSLQAKNRLYAIG